MRIRIHSPAWFITELLRFPDDPPEPRGEPEKNPSGRRLAQQSRWRGDETEQHPEGATVEQHPLGSERAEQHPVSRARTSGVIRSRPSGKRCRKIVHFITANTIALPPTPPEIFRSRPHIYYRYLF